MHKPTPMNNIVTHLGYTILRGDNMIEGDTEILYEDDEVQVIRITWMIGEEHGEKIITKEKGRG